MAKTHGPLFSLAASGSIGKVLTFNQGAHVQVARRSPRSTAPPSVPQIDYRNRCRAASAYWRAMPAAEKTEWSDVAALTGRPVFAKYLLEWISQAATPEQPPLLPMR